MIMKKKLMSVVAIFFPWLVLLLYDNPGGAFLALFLQATVVGWIPASMWAWRVIHETRQVNDQSEKEAD